MFFLALGIAYRLVRWAVRMPLWGDEVMLAVNFFGREPAHVFDPLEHGQVAPPMFVFYAWVVINYVSTSEWALRALSVASGIAGLWLFARLARALLEPVQALFAVAMLAVSYYTVRHGAEFKPYASDLLVSVWILNIGLWFERKPTPALRAGFAVTMITAAFFSYPAVFVVASVLTALTWRSWRQRDYRTLAFLFVVGIAAILFFAVQYIWFVGPHREANRSLYEYWVGAFPPGGVLANLAWVFRESAGRMLAYPVGGSGYASIVTLVLVVIGTVVLYQRRQRLLVGVLLLPFAYQLLAAFLGAYPYGTSARIAQHLAPSICILAGTGITALFGWKQRDVGTVSGGMAAVLLLFALLGIAGIVATILKPYKTEGVLEVRNNVEKAMREFQCDRLDVLNAKQYTPVNFLWYLLATGRAEFEVDPAAKLDTGDGRLCLYLFDGERFPQVEHSLNAVLRDRGGDFVILSDLTQTAYIYGGKHHPHQCRLVVLDPDSRN